MYGSHIIYTDYEDIGNCGSAALLNYPLMFVYHLLVDCQFTVLIYVKRTVCVRVYNYNTVRTRYDVRIIGCARLEIIIRVRRSRQIF